MQLLLFYKKKHMLLNLIRNLVLFLKNKFINNASTAFHAVLCDYIKHIFFLNYKIAITMLKSSIKNE